MTDKNFCMSSYLAFRYIAREDMDFFGGMRHESIPPILDSERIEVSTADEIGTSIAAQIDRLKGNSKLGLLLSGGMDSAIVASYMSGCDAYTFRFLGGTMQRDELARAEYYAKTYKLNLHYVDIGWNTVTKYVDACMERKCAPVHSIEPQIVQAALQAKTDGVATMLIGNGSDYVFGGMDGLLSRDWLFDDFVRRYQYLEPKFAVNNPVDMEFLFEPYRIEESRIDFLGFMDNIAIAESYSSYWNAFAVAEMPYYDPYCWLKMRDKLDLLRVRNGEPKYLIRELMAKRYPDIPVPNKLPMPRPVDAYFKDWKGVSRPEFRTDIDYSKLTGNQKWQLWCLERFLNAYDKEKK